MELDIFDKGKEYISASRAAEKLGYASDYIGQLCRARKVPGRLIGRTWYVDLPSLAAHKATRQLGKKKNSNPSPIALTAPLVSSSTIVFERDDRPLLPPLIKFTPPPVPRERRVVRDAVAFALSLTIALSAGFATLDRTSPVVAENMGNRLAKVSLTSEGYARGLARDAAATQVAAVSFFNLLSESAGFITESFRTLREIAFSRPRTDEGQLVFPRATPRTPLASTEVASTLDTSALRSELQASLESYIQAQISTLATPAPRIVYQTSSPTINTTVIREEILLADTRPTVTRQSSSDVDTLSRALTRLRDGTTFTNSTVSGTFSGTADLTALTFTNATGTNLYVSGLASTTEFRANTSSIGNLTSVFGTFTNLLVNGSTTLQNFSAQYASTTQIGSTGNAYFATSGGNVGIGTTNPSTKLEVSGGLLVTGSTTLQAFGATYASTTQIGSTGNAYFATAGGNVGIGTTTPWTRAGNVASKLDLTSSGTIFLTLHNTTTAQESEIVTDGTGLYLDVTGHTTATNNNIIFRTNATNGSYAVPERMRINSDGEVGIGITDPQGILHVRGSPAFGSVKLSPVSDNAGSVMAFTMDAAGTDTNDMWVVGQGGWDNTGDFTIGNENNGAGGNVRFLIEKSGNVGIGTSTPERKLDIFGTSNNDNSLRLKSNTAAVNATIALDAPATGESRVDFMAGGNNRNILYRPQNSDDTRFFSYAGGIGDFATFEYSTGMVGIGTTNPGRRLHVYGTEAIIGKFENTSTDATAVTITNTDASPQTWGIATAGSGHQMGDGTFYISNETTLAFPFAIDTNNQVGIGGIADPTKRLHVFAASGGEDGVVIENNSGGVSSSAMLRLTTGTGLNTAAILRFDANNSTRPGHLFITQPGNFPISFATQDTERLFIKGDGNIGIGTTTPIAKLTVNPAAGDANQFFVGSSTATALNSSLIIKNDGKIGIGTANPDGRLHLAVDNPDDSAVAVLQAAKSSNPVNILAFRTSRGTVANPTASQSGDILGGMSVKGYGASAFPASGRGAYLIKASETWTNSAQGTNHVWLLTPPTTTTESERMSLTSSSFSVSVDDPTDSSALIVTVAKLSSNPVAGSFFRTSRGTLANPSAVQAGDFIGGFGAKGYGATGYSASGRAAVFAAAQQNWTDSAHGTYLYFETTPSDSTTQSEKMRLTGEGRLGIGTTSPWRTLSVHGTAAFTGLSNNGTGYYACVNTAGGGSELATSTTACGASSIRYKENVADLTYGLNEVLALRPVSFDWKKDFMPGGTPQVGFIAEEVETLIPEVIGRDNQGTVMNLDYAKLTSVIVRAVQELYAQLTEIKNTVLAFAEKIISKEIVATEKLCIGETCVTEEQLISLLAGSGQSSSGIVTTTPPQEGASPAPETPAEEPEPQQDTETEPVQEGESPAPTEPPVEEPVGEDTSAPAEEAPVTP